ncbi:MAG TPA: M48 family metalloprotease [Candidatus Polarisedimenticolaceae bacterium]|nr:M48 family metalloprotease [Candidatus Polarisedimenticolaceae bacterium]
MSIRRLRRRVAWGLLATASVLTFHPLSAQVTIASGFNLFSTEQDIDIGRRSAAELEGRLPIVRDSIVDDYIGAIGRRLAADMPGATFPYRFKVVNALGLNAFALPGGDVYLHRELIAAAANEGQLAGVLAHEMAHVALRHGTHQASRAYVGQGGLGILGGLLVRDEGSTERVIRALGGFGLNAVFLEYSQADEEQADMVAARALARAGYDPQDMIDFFDVLDGNAGGGTVEAREFFGNSRLLRSAVAKLSLDPASSLGCFREAEVALQAVPPAPSPKDISPDQSASPPPSANAAPAPPPVRDLHVPPPSAKFRTFEPRNGLFRIEHPSNWRSYESADGLAVTIAPDGGFLDRGSDARDLTYGVVVRHYAPFLNDAGEEGTSLAAATNDLVRQVIRANPTLRRVLESQRIDTTASGRSAISLVFRGRSEVTGEEECVTVFAREVSDDHVIYALFVAPGRDYGQIKDIFARMMGSLRVKGVAGQR